MLGVSSARHLLLRDHFLRELPSVEHFEIVRLLAGAKKLHRHVDRLVHRDDDAASRRAIQLRDHET